MSAAQESRYPSTGPARLLALLVESPDLDAFLTEVTRLAAHLVTPTAACGITVRRDQHLVTVATSDGAAATLDQLQYATGEGPCLDSLRTGAVVQVDDLTREPRWTRFRTHAAGHHLSSSLSLPLHVDDQTVAVLNLYSDRPGAFAGPARQHAEAFAGQCAAALALALRQAHHAEIQQQVNEALASRSVIDQAIGILMSQQSCTAAAAFELLRAASQRSNRKLHDLAADIIVNLTGEPTEPPAPFRLAD